MITKATDKQKALYKGLYPLYGYIVVDKRVCAVEHPNEGQEGVNYEVMAPDGYHFARPEDVHSFCCTTLADVRDRCNGANLAPCTEHECDC